MKTLKDGLGTCVGFLMVSGFAGLMLALVGSLASEQLPALKGIVTGLRCIVGFPAEGSACVSRKLAALDDERRALSKQVESLFGGLAEQSLVFTPVKRVKDSVYVVVGTLYQNPAARSGLIRSFCWVALDNEGIDLRVGLAVMHSDGRIENLSVTAKDLVPLDIDASEASAARAACPFPAAI